jgi:hypothetical protein
LEIGQVVLAIETDNQTALPAHQGMAVSGRHGQVAVLPGAALHPQQQTQVHQQRNGAIDRGLTQAGRLEFGCRFRDGGGPVRMQEVVVYLPALTGEWHALGGQHVVDLRGRSHGGLFPACG